MMPELSRSQIDKLGKRLRQAGPNNVSDEDLNLLEQLLATHQTVLTTVQLRLAKELELPVTGRTKSTGTLVEKLQRSPTMALSRMQDIAGARLVAEMNRTVQDQLVARIVELFPGAEKKDRRAEPSHGYRAVHVIVKYEQWFVEIQVRTTLQDLWAQVFERLADRWGRGIRYGDLPNDPDAEVGSGYTRREIVELLMEQSERLHIAEELAVEFAEDERAQVETDELAAELEAYPGLKSDPKVAELLQSLEASKKRIQRLKERHLALEEDERKFLQLLRGLE
jgi:ppGpp synthetase/RelA/SpoT-type nucleotidyltranferase